MFKFFLIFLSLYLSCSLPGGVQVVDPVTKVIVCKCNAGWAGDKCQCSQPSNTTGTRNITSDGSCVCWPGFVGDQCQESCWNNGMICSNRGQCSMSSALKKAVCQCTPSGITGDYCEIGCETISGLLCNGRGSCLKNQLGNDYCRCSGNFSGLACTDCLKGYYGSQCTLRCPGQAGVNNTWDGCYESLGRGSCLNNSAAGTAVCRCNPPYVDDCRSDHFGIPPPETVLDSTWATFSPRQVTAGQPFTIKIRGLRTVVTSAITAKISQYSGNCIGLGPNTSEVVLDPISRQASLKAPSSTGSYAICLKWRIDWEYIRQAPGVSLPLVVVSENKQSPYYGYFHCSALLQAIADSGNRTVPCGCYYEGTSALSYNAPLDFSASDIISASSSATVYQGCCAPVVEKVQLGVVSTGGRWGVCTYTNW